jgi:hypothetical protein
LQLINSLHCNIPIRLRSYSRVYAIAGWSNNEKGGGKEGIKAFSQHLVFINDFVVYSSLAIKCVYNIQTPCPMKITDLALMTGLNNCIGLRN